jgi:hypothetical protein
MKGRTALGLSVLLLVVLIAFTVHSTVDSRNDQPPAPPPTAVLPDGLETYEVPLGGQLYLCVLYYRGGVDCDWGHPIAASPASTPRPTETPR